MNILVIGNGFDLAHGLPTKYKDFLEFYKHVLPIYENIEGRGIELYQQDYLVTWKFNAEIKETLIDAYKSRKKVTVEKNILQFQTNYPKLDEMYIIIKDNIWIKYFLECNMYQKENWIDFETEISEMIQSFDRDIKGKNFYGQIESLTNEFLEKRFLYDDFEYLLSQNKGEKKKITYVQLRDILINDLNRLIRALEIYLAEYVEKIDITRFSNDIRKLHIDYVISFNYSHTYKKLYDESKEIEYDYIHGEAKNKEENRGEALEKNNMVLGIDEYLTEDRKNKDIEFIAFKKYYQRIYKQTGNKYKKWISEIREKYTLYIDNIKKLKDMSINGIVKSSSKAISNTGVGEMAYHFDTGKYEEHYIYIFGHSLDVTDGDVLRDLILNDNVYTTIFYLNKDVMGQQIANLVKVIGQDELIRRTGGSTKTIEFKQQQDMVPR